MAIRWTEEEAINYGFRKDSQGWWEAPKKRELRSSIGEGGLRRVNSSSSDEMSIDKRDASDGPSAKVGGKEEIKVASKDYGRKFEITVTSFSRFHCDPDNLCPKYFIDELVRAGLLEGDSSRHISWIKKQVVKVKNEEEERTEIVVNVVKENKN